jgi:hypothetical protein
LGVVTAIDFSFMDLSNDRGVCAGVLTAMLFGFGMRSKQIDQELV